MAMQAWKLAIQSFSPFGIAFQLDPEQASLGALYWMFAALIAFGVWLARRSIPLVAFAILYVLALITVRLGVPASNWLDRAPEMWYTQQWYPALPGMVWLLVSLFVRDDASPSAPSAD